MKYFYTKKENKIRNLFEQEEENRCKPLPVGNFWSNDYNYIKYESNGDKNKTPFNWRIS